MADHSVTSPPPARWPVGTMALAGVCVAGMLIGAVWALNPPEPPPPRPRGMPGAGPLSGNYGVPPPNAPRRDEVPARAGDLPPR